VQPRMMCAAQDERTFPQWLSGLIGVSGFLLVAFVSFLVKKLWCESSDPRSAAARLRYRLKRGELGRSVDVELVQENVYVEDLDDLRSKKPANVNK
uniref:Uncharacterized protein n=1 Tax=Salarias fasciatus TaxID=181472 RepID=A0A672JEQ4_SALFA